MSDHIELPRIYQFLGELLIVTGKVQRNVWKAEKSGESPKIFDDFKSAFIKHAAKAQTEKWARLYHVENNGMGSECEPITDADIQGTIENFLQLDLFYGEENQIEIDQMDLEHLLGEKNYWIINSRINKLSEAEYEYVVWGL